MKVIDAQVSTDVIMKANKRAMERFFGRVSTKKWQLIS